MFTYLSNVAVSFFAKKNKKPELFNYKSAYAEACEISVFAEMAKSGNSTSSYYFKPNDLWRQLDKNRHLGRNKGHQN